MLGPDAGEPAPASPTVADIVPDMDGFLYEGECDGGSASFECPMKGCDGGVLMQATSFAVGGQPDTVYELELHVYGVVELRSDYTGGTRRQGMASNAESSGDFWYDGGSYTPGAGYNVYSLTVTPGVGDGDSDSYFLNARDRSAEGHEVWELDFEASVRVAGGGSIEFLAYDPNCLQIMNNSETARPAAGSGPNGAIISTSVEMADPSPDGLEQPVASDGRAGQWIYIDVVNVSVP